MHSGYKIAFGGTGSWSFNDDFARNVNLDNLKNDFLILGGGDIFDINGSFGAPEKKDNVNLIKAKTKVCFSLHYNTHNS